MNLAPYLDHTLLSPGASPDEVTLLCEQAREHGFASVCVASMWVPLAAQCLAGSDVAVGTVAGFPHGNNLTAVKAYEASAAVELGAREIDMVIAIGALRAGLHTLVRDDIRAVVTAAATLHPDALVKVIIETSLLDETQKRRACELAADAGAHFVKTSSGFNGGGATVDDVRLMKATVGSRCGVKAAGGIRDAAFARALVEAGASRLGSSQSVGLVASV